MTRYQFTAMSAGTSDGVSGARGVSQGGLVRGEREASDETALRAALRADGLIVVEVKTHSLRGAFSRGGGATGWRGLVSAGSGAGRVRNDDRSWFFQTLAMMLKHSVPIEVALGTMEELAPNPTVRWACGSVRSALRGGSSLTDAVGGVPGLAGAQHLALLRSGQASGRLDHAVALIEQSIASSARLRSALLGGLFYPAILLVASIGVLWVLATFVIPRFAETLGALGGELPWQTRVTFGAAGVMVWLFPALLVLVLASWRTRRMWMSGATRVRLHDWSLRLPVIGTMLWNAQGAVVCDTMATMIEGGGDALSALGQARDVASNPVIARKLQTAEKRTREGVELGKAFHELSVLPPTPTALLQIAVRAGDLTGGLRQAGELCREQQERVGKRLMALMGPAVILVMALGVGWVVWSLISGMLALNEIGSSL